MMTVKSSVTRNRPKTANQKPAPVLEAKVWQPLYKGWKQLYGGVKEPGVSVESHDFETAGELEWSRSFHPESLELCLNLAGRGSVGTRHKNVEFAPLTAGF